MKPLLHLGDPRGLWRRDGGLRAPARAAKCARSSSLSRRCRLHHEERAECHHRARLRLAVAQAQHALREMADTLKKEGVEVKSLPPSPADARH